MKRLFKVFGVGLAITLLLIGMGIGILALSESGEYNVPPTTAEDGGLPFVTLKGYRFHSETFGNPKNPVLIVLHGGPGGDYRYLYSLKPLADKYFLVFYDQRGSGLSPRVDKKEITLQSFIDDLDAFVEYYGGGKPVYLIGHSWGAMLGSSYLGQYPHKVKKAVLAEPGFLDAETAKPLLEAGPSTGVILAVARSWMRSRYVDAGGDLHAKGDYFYLGLMKYSTPDYYCGGVYPEQARMWRGGFAVFQATAGRLMGEPEFLKTLSFRRGVNKYSGPVLFIASVCNTLVGVKHQKRQMKFFKNARLLEVPNSGHMMFNERPGFVLPRVREFLGE